MKKIALLFSLLLANLLVAQDKEVGIGLSLNYGPGNPKEFNRAMDSLNAGAPWLSKKFGQINTYHGWGLHAFVRTESIFEYGLTFDRMYGDIMHAQGSDSAMTNNVNYNWWIRHRLSNFSVRGGIAPFHWLSFGINYGIAYSTTQSKKLTTSQEVKFFDWMFARLHQNKRDNRMLLGSYINFHLHKEGGDFGLDIQPYYNLVIGKAEFLDFLDKETLAPNKSLPTKTSYSNFGVRVVFFGNLDD